MKFSAGFISLLAVSAKKQGDDEERHVGVNAHGQEGNDDHTPLWRLGQLIGFANDLFDSEAFTGPNTPKFLSRAGTKYKKMFNANAVRMDMAYRRNCKYYNKDDYFGGPNAENPKQEGYDSYPTRTQRRRRDTGDWNDDSETEIDQLRLSWGNPQLMTKEITTGFRKWAKRYIGHCNGQWKRRHHFHRMHKWNRTLQKKFIQAKYEFEEGTTDFSDNWYVKPIWTDPKTNEEHSYVGKAETFKVTDPEGMDAYIEAYGNRFEEELVHDNAIKFGKFHKQKVNFPDYNEDDKEA